jgi:hypothetical protein
MHASWSKATVVALINGFENVWDVCTGECCVSTI